MSNFYQTTRRQDFFDYGEYAEITSKPYIISNVVYFSVISLIFLLGILGTFGVLILLMIKKGRDFRGVRWYCFNLMLFNILYLIFAIFNNNQYPFSNMVNSQIKTFFKNYHPTVRQWCYTVYCISTWCLFIETISRFFFARCRNNRGFYHAFWLFYLVINDCLPGIYGIVKTSAFRYVYIDPDPLAVYHAVGFVLLWLGFGLMFLSLFCCLCRHTDDNSLRFSRRSFIFIFIFAIITIWWQCPAAYDIANGIMEAKIELRELTALTQKYYVLIAPLTITKDYAEYSVPAVIAWSMILFMPSISIFNFGVRKTTAVTRISDSHDHLTAVPKV